MAVFKYLIERFALKLRKYLLFTCTKRSTVEMDSTHFNINSYCQLQIKTIVISLLNRVKQHTITTT